MLTEINADCYNYLVVFSILFSIVNLVFLALYKYITHLLIRRHISLLPLVQTRERKMTGREVWRKGQTMPVSILAFSTHENLEVCSQRFSLISSQMYKINLGTYFLWNEPQIVLKWYLLQIGTTAVTWNGTDQKEPPFQSKRRLNFTPGEANAKRSGDQLARKYKTLELTWKVLCSVNSAKSHKGCLW